MDEIKKPLTDSDVDALHNERIKERVKADFNIFTNHPGFFKYSDFEKSTGQTGPLVNTDTSSVKTSLIKK